jgi:hypothetical protein
MYLYKNIKYLIIIALIAIVTILYMVNYEIRKNYCFEGVVENVYYNDKGTPTVTINKESFFLGYNDWDFSIVRVEKGDIMIKKKGDMNLKIIKMDSKDTINFFN